MMMESPDIKKKRLSVRKSMSSDYPQDSSKGVDNNETGSPKEEKRKNKGIPKGGKPVTKSASLTIVQPDVLSLVKEGMSKGPVKSVASHPIISKGLAVLKKIHDKTHKPKSKSKKGLASSDDLTSSKSESESFGNYSDNSLESFDQTSPIGILRKSSPGSSQEEYAIPLFTSNSAPGTPAKDAPIRERRLSLLRNRSRSQPDKINDASRSPGGRGSIIFEEKPRSLSETDRTILINSYNKDLDARKDWDEVEMLPDPDDTTIQLIDIPKCKENHYRIEVGCKYIELFHNEIEGTSNDIPYYSLYFKGKDHLNYVTMGLENKAIGPVAISIELPNGKEEYKKVIIRTKKGNEMQNIPPQYTSSTSSILKYLKNAYPYLNTLRLSEVSDTQLQVELERYEKNEMFTEYKIGVMYAKEGQSEDEMFSNVEVSQEFEEFLQILGDRIELQGWEGYRGGLDTKQNTTGLQSIHTKFATFDIMFHVATMLPYQPEDEQRIERKRHIGNDICVVIFKEGNSPLDPTIFTSHFNHVFAVVQLEKKDDQVYYRLAFANKHGVLPYGPYLPYPAIIEKSKFRQFFLTKLINSERAALHAPPFKEKMERTRYQLLTEIGKFFTSQKRRSMRKSRLWSTDSQEKLEVPVFGDEELLLSALKSYKDKSSFYLQQLEEKTNQNYDSSSFLNLLNNATQVITENSVIKSFDERRIITEAAQSMKVSASEYMHVREKRDNNVELATGKYEEVLYVFLDCISKLSLAIELATRPLNKKLEVESKGKLINDVIRREETEIAKEQQKLTEMEIMIIKEEHELFMFEKSILKMEEQLCMLIDEEIAKFEAVNIVNNPVE